MKKFEYYIDSLLISDENKSHYVYNKYFKRFVCNKTKCKTKQHIWRYCLQCLTSNRSLIEYKETYLKINGKQNVKSKSGSIKFINFFKKLTVLFKIYTDIECNIKEVKYNNKNNDSYTKKYQNNITCCFGYKVVCNDDKYSKPVVLYRGKNEINKFVEIILKKYDYCKKIIKKSFNKNLFISEEDEEIFQ